MLLPIASCVRACVYVHGSVHSKFFFVNLNNMRIIILLTIFSFIAFSGYGFVSIMVFIIGKVGIAIVFNFVYMWCSEFYPSTLRSTLLGLSSLSARVGSVLAPVIVDLVNLKLLCFSYFSAIWKLHVIIFNLMYNVYGYVRTVYSFLVLSCYV